MPVPQAESRRRRCVIERVVDRAFRLAALLRDRGGLPCAGHQWLCACDGLRYARDDQKAGIDRCAEVTEGFDAMNRGVLDAPSLPPSLMQDLPGDGHLAEHGHGGVPPFDPFEDA